MAIHSTVELEFAARLLTKAHQPFTRRFAVYRNNLFVSLVDALMTRYPAVQASVGTEFFSAMARDYVADHLPDTPLMMCYGDTFPDYLEEFEPLADYRWMADLARIERAVTHVYHAADQQEREPLDLVMSQDPDIHALKFQLIDALRIVTSPYPVVTLWKMNTGQIEPNSVDDMKPESALIFRSDVTVNIMSLTSADAAFISALRERLGIGDAFEIAIAHNTDFDLTALLTILIREKLIARIITPKTGLDKL
jgi:hypothetical protein